MTTSNIARGSPGVLSHKCLLWRLTTRQLLIVRGVTQWAKRLALLKNGAQLVVSFVQDRGLFCVIYGPLFKTVMVKLSGKEKLFLILSVNEGVLYPQENPINNLCILFFFYQLHIAVRHNNLTVITVLYYVAIIVRALWLAAERSLFSCNDRALRFFFNSSG